MRVLLAAAAALAAGVLASPPRVPQMKSGIYYIDSCEENAPCCLDGFIAVAKDGYLTFNLAGFSQYCGKTLNKGFDERTGNLRVQVADTELFAQLVEIPHDASGTQYMEFSMRENATRMDIRNIGAVRVISSGTATWVVSLEDGVKDGLSRDPGMRYVDNPPIDGEGDEQDVETMSFIEAAMLAVFCTCIAYTVAGFLYTKRGPNKQWDGKWEHVHAEQWREAYVLTKTKLVQVKDKIQAMRDRGSMSTVDIVVSEDRPAPIPFSITAKAPLRRDLEQPESPKRSNHHHFEPRMPEETSFGTPSKARRPSKTGWFGSVRPPFFGGGTATSSSVAVSEDVIVSAAIVSPPPKTSRRNSLTRRNDGGGNALIVVEERGEWV